MQFKPRFSVILQIFFIGGRLQLSRRRSRKFYVLTQVFVVYLRFPAVREPWLEPVADAIKKRKNKLHVLNLHHL